MLADFAALGVEIKLEPADEAEDGFPVWDSNWRSLLAFLDAETQWRAVAGFGGVLWLGLDYAGLRPLIEHGSGRVDGKLFADIRAMERAALPVLNAPRPES